MRSQIAPRAVIGSGAALGAVAVAGDTATLTITEGSGAPTTAVGAFTVALAANSAGIRDVFGHTATFAAQAPLDRAAPAPVTMTLVDLAIILPTLLNHFVSGSFSIRLTGHVIVGSFVH